MAGAGPPRFIKVDLTTGDKLYIGGGGRIDHNYGHGFLQSLEPSYWELLKQGGVGSCGGELCR